MFVSNPEALENCSRHIFFLTCIPIFPRIGILMEAASFVHRCHLSMDIVCCWKFAFVQGHKLYLGPGVARTKKQKNFK